METAILAGIDKKKDALVMVSTAVLTAWLMPGASTAANAAEAAGGAAVKAAGNAAEKIGKEAAKQNLSQKIGDLLSKRATQQAGESAGKVGKVAENVGKNASKQVVKETSKFAKFLGAMGTVIKDINPLEHVVHLLLVRLRNLLLKGLLQIIPPLLQEMSFLRYLMLLKLKLFFRYNKI